MGMTLQIAHLVMVRTKTVTVLTSPQSLQENATDPYERFAYDATCDYKVDNDGADGLEGQAQTLKSQLCSIAMLPITFACQIIAGVWNTRYLDTEALVRAAYPDTISAMRAAQANGTLIVFAAGNDGYLNPDSSGGLPHVIPELANEWLVVVAVDSSLNETNYTNRCGVAADFCVTAPGGGDAQATDGILAARANGSLGDDYVRYSGMSMAAPHVAGLAAALMEKFPSLTPAQIATRIKSTASYSGLTGTGGETPRIAQKRLCKQSLVMD